MQTIHQSIEQLRSALCDYIEAAYHIGAESLIVQRKDLLDLPGLVYQTPYLESTPRYRTGERFSDIDGLPSAALEAFAAVSNSSDKLPQLIYDPPYRHQAEAVRGCLVDRRNLIVMTGTGSGKTECFLLPILGKLAQEAMTNPSVFSQNAAMRALVLYPMNALVNDQLGRLRALFGDPRLVRLFEHWAGRPPRFARYTSRTPYPGVRNAKKDSKKLSAFNEFYVNTERLAHNPMSDGHAEAKRLLDALKDHGKWPAKPDLREWLGDKGSKWQDRSGAFVRAVVLPGDSELLTRHEVQTAPPDLLVTNYSMLEYMLMRPIERSIFDATRAFLACNPDEDFIVVLDEAHLYRGAAGAEVGLLLRRLRDRLAVSADRFRVICATASFQDSAYAPQFGAQLSGLQAESFLPITGTLVSMPSSQYGTQQDADVLANVDLKKYHIATTAEERLAVIRPILEYRQVYGNYAPEVALHHAFADFGPMTRLASKTMKEAVPLIGLGQELFPAVSPDRADVAVTVLIALGSIARLSPDVPGLMRSRIHSFFRGLPGLWVCMDPSCTEIDDAKRTEICGKMYSQPHKYCKCGARVMELYSCRDCGTAYARAYTDDVERPTVLWSEAGQEMVISEGEVRPLWPLDLLLELPTKEELTEPADFDIETGHLNPRLLGRRSRRVYVPSDRISKVRDGDGEALQFGEMTRGQFTQCGVCGGRPGFSPVQDHQTKGNEPFQALVARQLQIQQPNKPKATKFAPLQGRKVLVFSDSRQVAARLAPNLQMYSLRDSLRSLIAAGYRRLQSVDRLRPRINLEDLYFAVLLAGKVFNVRLRPELRTGESFGVAENCIDMALPSGSAGTAEDIEGLWIELRGQRAPESLLENIVEIFQSRYLSLEALAIASVSERNTIRAKLLESLPSLPGIAESEESKLAVVRFWLRCWRNSGFWLNSMPTIWWKRRRTEGISIRGHSGKFKAMDMVLANRESKACFRSQWLPELLKYFTEDPDHGTTRRLRGSELTLEFEGRWIHCNRCKSVHRPVPGLRYCLDCRSSEFDELEPDEDRVFTTRRGYFRRPVIEALDEDPRGPMVLVAAEHTAQLNAPQQEDVFSKAEENELLFQDIELKEGSTAIDVLSSTTTMEVGIDIGMLSGVALRNMPPSRANYQQRSGRAGRRGESIATVLAFGSADSHDEHYFAEPDEMIRGDVIDPKLTLDNRDLARRHIRAFLLQNYHQDRLPGVDPSQPSDLFSVLGTVSDFRKLDSVLNRYDFAKWLEVNEESLRERVRSWIPEELSADDRDLLLSEMISDCLTAVKDAIQLESDELEIGRDSEGGIRMGESSDESFENVVHSNKLLDRLLYCGKLPRYAFPTDVVSFYVFDEEKYVRFRPVMRFAPQRGLPIALNEYAPGKQVTISGKCFTSGAIYSINPDERVDAWRSKKMYMECRACGFAKTYSVAEVDRNDRFDCEACGGAEKFGPGRFWIRPTGFAHPVDKREKVTSAEGSLETSYATRAKLSIGTPGDEAGWVKVNERIRVLHSRQHLLVSNTGPRGMGYTYCVKCGRIEVSSGSAKMLTDSHLKPFPEEDGKQLCDVKRVTRHIVLGTDFVTDIALFSIRIDMPFVLRPAQSSTKIALRTVSEALAKAGCKLLEIEPGELMAEFRPAVTQDGRGKTGQEVEVFLYDTLPGGAGFSRQLADCGLELFQLAYRLMTSCSENCDASCYRCLRSFKNKFEHSVLDRHVGAELLGNLLTGIVPEFDQERLRSSTVLLYHDLKLQASDGLQFRQQSRLPDGNTALIAPIVADVGRGGEIVVALSAPLTPDCPADQVVAEFYRNGGPTIVEDELLVRGNLPAATRRVCERLIGSRK